MTRRGRRSALPLRRRVGGGARDECHPRRLPLSGGADAEVHGAQVDGADAMQYGDGAQRPRAGAVRVELALNGVDFEGEVPFTYYVEPSILSVTPTGGPHNGGTVVRVDGAGFAPFDQNGTYIEQWGASAIASSRVRARPARRRGDGAARC